MSVEHKKQLRAAAKKARRIRRQQRFKDAVDARVQELAVQLSSVRGQAHYLLEQMNKLKSEKENGG